MIFKLALAAGLVCLLGYAGYVGWSFVAYSIRYAGRRERPVVSDAAIILGAYTNGFQPSPALLQRLRAALHLYRYGLVAYLIVSGGKGEDETISESRSMKRFLILNGVPADSILEDRYSTDTWENLCNSQQVMLSYGLQTAVIVTSDYHLPRAMAVAKRLQMEATGFASISQRAELRLARREVIAWLKYTWQGQIDWRAPGRRMFKMKR